MHKNRPIYFKQNESNNGKNQNESNNGKTQNSVN